MNKRSLKGKFNIDLAWNALSFLFIALAGLAINIIIIKRYDSYALGVFNQLYALYILFSQISTGGFHLAIQYYVPLAIKNKEEVHKILISSIILCLASSIVVLLLVFIFVDIPGQILQSEDVRKGYPWLMWGLLFFSLNKIIISYFNGLRKMKIFAFLQALRFLFILLFMGIIILLNKNTFMLASSLAFAELFLFICCVVFLLVFEKVKYSTIYDKTWIQRIFNFGKHALTGNFLLDVNTKVDVFILGLFLKDNLVGIYSFASTFFEGLSQLPVLLRNNINPILTRLHSKSNKLLTQTILYKSKRAFYKLQIPIFIIALAGFYFILLIFQINENRMAYFGVFSILTLGLIVSAGYQPFLMLFNQFGKPRIQTYFIFSIFISNVVFNLLLVPYFGIFGAALGTTLSFIVQIIGFEWLIKKGNKNS